MDTKKTIQAINRTIQLSQPAVWINTSIPYAVGYITVASQMGLSFWIGLIYFLLPYNLLMFGVNEIYSTENAENQAKRSIKQTLGNKKQHKIIWYAIVFTNFPFVLAITVLAPGAIAKLFFLILIGFCFSYSMPPLRLKGVPILDSLNSSLLFVSPLLFGILFAGVSNIAPYLIALVAFLLWGMASQALTAIRDIKADRRAQVTSTATLWGARRTNRLVIVLYSLAAIMIGIGYFPIGLIGTILLSLYVLNASFFLKYISDARSGQFYRAWQNFRWLNPLVGFGLILLLLWSYNAFNFQANWLIYTSFGLLVLSLIGLSLELSNLWLMHIKRNQPHPAHWPRVSILLSCYNQSATIVSTLLAALGQDYPDFEVLVADLGSTDATTARLKSQQDKRLRIIELESKPSDWQIQNWSMEQLRLKAHGEILVVLHEDVLLYPTALSNLVTQLSSNSVDFISVQAGDTTKQLNHQLSISQTIALLQGWCPMLIKKLLHQSFSTWPGQITACHARKLEKMRGFNSCKTSPTANLDIQRLAAKRGQKVSFVLGSGIASSHYHQEVINSTQYLSQQAYTQLYKSLPLVAFVCSSVVVIGILPIVLFVWQFIVLGGFEAWLLLGSICIYYLHRLIAGIALKQHLVAVALFPIADVVVVFCIIRSMLDEEFSTPRWHSSLTG